MRRILVTGAGGLVGSALVQHLSERGEEVIPLVSRQQCDLTVPTEVSALMKFVRPTHIFHLAASVFGVGGNLKFPAEVFYRNTIMNTTLVEACHNFGVEKIVAMGSAAMYADGLEQPMRESDAMLGEPHGSEYGYAMSKRTLLAQLKTYRQQYDLNFGFVIATNMYGPRDMFNTLHGHVVPSLLKKFLDAEESGEEVEIWGDGTPTRDFLYSADAASGLMAIMDHGEGPYNLATGISVPISHLVIEIAAHFPQVRYRWNVDKPKGQISRSYDVSLLQALGFVPRYSLHEGIAETVSWLREYREDIRK